MNKSSQIVGNIGSTGIDSIVRKPKITGIDSIFRSPVIPGTESKFVPCSMCGGSGVIKTSILIGTCGDCLGLGKKFNTGIL